MKSLRKQIEALKKQAIEVENLHINAMSVLEATIEDAQKTIKQANIDIKKTHEAIGEVASTNVKVKKVSDNIIKELGNE